MSIRLAVSVVLLILLAPAVAAQSHPCDTAAPPSAIAAGQPFRIQACQPGGEVVEGVDVSLDNGPAVEYTPVDLGFGLDGRRAWQITIPSGLVAGAHVVRLAAWNYERDAAGTRTARKRYASPVELTIKPRAAGDRQFSPAVTHDLAVLPPKFAIGQRVQAWQCDSPAACETLGNGVAVRTTPALNAPMEGVHEPGVEGTITAGPQYADGFTWWQITYAVPPNGWSTDSNLVAAGSAVDCAGTWSEWSPWSDWALINPTTEQRSRSRTFTTTTEPSGGGALCPVSPEIQTETRPVAAGSAPTPTGCRWTLTANPPDTTTGWRAQWRQNEQTIGPRDGSAPFSRTFNVSPGAFRYDVVWSKSTGDETTSPAVVMNCGG